MSSQPLLWMTSLLTDTFLCNHCSSASLNLNVCARVCGMWSVSVCVCVVCVCMCLCVCLCVCYVSLHVCVCLCHLCLCVSVSCVSVCVYVMCLCMSCVNACLYVSVCTCVSISLCVYLCVCSVHNKIYNFYHEVHLNCCLTITTIHCCNFSSRFEIPYL